MADVVGAALDRLKRLEAHRAVLLDSVIAAEQEGERDGFLTIDEVMTDAEAFLEELAGTPR